MKPRCPIKEVREEKTKMSNDIHVPKEQFLVDLFKSAKTRTPGTSDVKPFSDFLSSAQVKVQKADLSGLLEKPVEEAEKDIEKMDNSSAVSAIRQSVEILQAEQA